MGLGDQDLGEMRPLIQLYALGEGVRCVFNVFQVRRCSHIYIYIYIYVRHPICIYIYMSALHQCCIYVNYDLMSAHDYCDFTVTFRTQGLRNSSPHYSFNVLGIWVFLNVAI